MLLVVLSIILSLLLIVPIYNTFMITGYIENTKKCQDIDYNDVNLVGNVNTLTMYILTLIALISIIKTIIVFRLHKN